jgi:uncharacterized protein YegL
VPINFYFVIDLSGSTGRDGLHIGWVRAMPEIIKELEAASGEIRFCLLSYASEAAILVPLTLVADLVLLPTPEPGGFSSLAAALRLLATVVERDRAQLAADGIADVETRILIVTDGLATDSDSAVLAARAGFQADTHLVVPAATPPLAVAGLGMIRHRLEVGEPGQVVKSLIAASRAVLAGCGGSDRAEIEQVTRP